MLEHNKFISTCLVSLSTMVNLQLPHLNVLTKNDLLDKRGKRIVDDLLEGDPVSVFARLDQELNSSEEEAEEGEE